MRRAEMRQHQLFVADCQLHRLVEHRCRGRIDQSAPVEFAAHRFIEEGAAIAVVFPVSGNLQKVRRRPYGIFVGAGATRDDVGALNELIAESMVAIGMRVDQLLDPSRRRDGVAHGREHFRGQRQIEQGIDQQRLIATYDQARVAPTPRSIRLQISKTAPAKIVQSLGVLPLAHVF